MYTCVCVLLHHVDNLLKHLAIFGYLSSSSSFVLAIISNNALKNLEEYGFSHILNNFMEWKYWVKGQGHFVILDLYHQAAFSKGCLCQFRYFQQCVSTSFSPPTPLSKVVGGGGIFSLSSRGGGLKETG